MRLERLGQSGDVQRCLCDEAARQRLARREHAPVELVVNRDSARTRREAGHRRDGRNDGAQVGWMRGCRGPLVLARVRPAEQRHIAGAPRLRSSPFHQVVAVVGLLGAVAEEDTLGVAPSAAIHRYEREPLFGELHTIG